MNFYILVVTPDILLYSPRLRKDEGVEDAKLEPEQVAGLDDVDAGHILVHRSQDDLEIRRER